MGSSPGYTSTTLLLIERLFQSTFSTLVNSGSGVLCFQAWSWGPAMVLGLCHGLVALPWCWGPAMVLGPCHGVGALPWSWGPAMVLGPSHGLGALPWFLGFVMAKKPCGFVLGLCHGLGPYLGLGALSWPSGPALILGLCHGLLGAFVMT